MSQWIELIILVVKTMMAIREDSKQGNAERAAQRKDTLHAAGEVWRKGDLSAAASLLSGELQEPADSDQGN